MNARRPSYASLLLAAGLALSFPGVALAAPAVTPVPSPTAPASAQRQLVVVQPSHPVDDAILQGTKPLDEYATVKTAWGFQERVMGGTTQVNLRVPTPPAGWVADKTYILTYIPDGGPEVRYEVVRRESGPGAPGADPDQQGQATVVQPDTRFDTAWVVVPTAEAGGWFRIRTDYGLHQKYAGGAYGVFPPPAGGWVPGTSYRVAVTYASGRSSTVQVQLSADAADPGLRGSLSGPDASGALTVQLTGVPVGEEIHVTAYTADMGEQIARVDGRAASTSPQYRLVSKDWRQGQTYVVMATVGAAQPMGDYRWVQSFTYHKPTQKPDNKPTQPARKDHSGGLANTGR